MEDLPSPSLFFGFLSFDPEPLPGFLDFGYELDIAVDFVQGNLQQYSPRQQLFCTLLVARTAEKERRTSVCKRSKHHATCNTAAYDF